MIEYGTHHIDKKGNYNPTVNPAQNFVVSMSEGQFKNGLLQGFARCHDHEGECRVGYWKALSIGDGVQVSRPYGKFAHYYKDGSFKTPDGIYQGNFKEWNHMLKERQINDYLRNELNTD